MSQKHKEKQPNLWLSHITIASQMGLIIYLFSYLGNRLDTHYDTENALFFKSLTVFGVFVAIINTIRQLKQTNR